MGFLRRALGGGDPGPNRDPILALAREAVAANGRVYTRATCPNCEALLAKLPGRSGKCPTCGQHIAYVRGADGLAYLVREADAGPVRAEVDAHWAASGRSGGREDIGAMRRYCRTFLARYAALGAQVWVAHVDDACAECRRLHGRLLDPADLPDLPLGTCRKAHCLCHYRPTLGDAPPPDDGESASARVGIG